MARERGWDVVEAWRTVLTSMPAEVELEVLERFRQAFTAKDLGRLGLAKFFHRRLPSRLRAALRTLAGSAKRLVFGVYADSI
jgi:hypothetical protein